MLLDIKTLMVCNAVLTVFISIALVIYWSDQKTYYGFRLWIAASILTTMAYAALILRGVIPLWVSILITNALFVLAGIGRLDGIIRFLTNRTLNKVYYAAPIPVVALCLYFYFVDDRIVMRNLFTAISLFLISLGIFRQLTKYAPGNHKTLYQAAAVFNIGIGVFLLSRAIVWLSEPTQDIFLSGIVHTLYFLIAMIYEVGLGMLFFMMNSQRTEDTLIEAQNELHTTVTNLEHALSEIKTLGGLLPICASCKKIRDDKGYWNQLESYISSHSAAEFSHSICPDCIKKLYPEIADQLLEELEDTPEG